MNDKEDWTMWSLTVGEQGVSAELDNRGRYARVLKEAGLAALLFVVGFSIISLPDELLNPSEEISPLGRLAWHGFLGLLAAIVVVATRWNRRNVWSASPAGVWFTEHNMGEPDIRASDITEVVLDNRPLRSRRLVIRTHDEKKVVLCRGFRSGQDPEKLHAKMVEWFM